MVVGAALVRSSAEQELTLEEARQKPISFWMSQVCTQPGDHVHAVREA